MKNTARCPKCGSHNLVRVPDDAHRYLGNSISITKVVPVARYVCCDCGYGGLGRDAKGPGDPAARVFPMNARKPPALPAAFLAAG